MEPFKITVNQLVFYFVIANVVLGFLFGFFPLVAGLLMKKRKYAIYGLIASIVGGGVLGIFLSFPMALLFTWLILRKTGSGKSTETETRTDSEPS